MQIPLLKRNRSIEFSIARGNQATDNWSRKPVMLKVRGSIGTIKALPKGKQR
jgi:hypothetical protein